MLMMNLKDISYRFKDAYLFSHMIMMQRDFIFDILGFQNPVDRDSMAVHWSIYGSIHSAIHSKNCHHPYARFLSYAHNHRK